MSWLSRFFRTHSDVRQRDPRLKTFRAEVVEASTRPISIETLAQLESRRAALNLDEDEAAVELEMIEGLRRVLDLSEHAARGSLPVVETTHRVLGTDTCYFAAPVSRIGTAGDQSGKLFLTDRRAVFLGSGVVTVTWGLVNEIVEDDRDVLLINAARAEAHRFRCNSFMDSKGAVFVARWLRQRSVARRG